jgi:hemolysin III
MDPGESIAPFVFRHPLSAGLHLFWALWSAYAAAILWRLARGDRTRQWSVGVFGFSMVLLYTASGMYHAVSEERPRLLQTFRLLDHSAIYVLIAGTYTPIFVVLLQNPLRVVLLTVIWALALAGVACKWLLPLPPHALTVGLYLAMGWVGLVPVVPLTKALGWRGMFWGLLGGLFYTLGGACELLRWPVLVPGVVSYHEVLHVFDMAGTLTHVYFISRYVLPFRRASSSKLHVSSRFPAELPKYA